MTAVRLLLLCALLTGAPLAQALELGELMRKLAARGDATASFVEEQTLATLDRPLRSTGELRFRSNGELEKRTLTPRPEVLRYADGVAWTERGSRRVRLDLQRYPQILPLVESIRGTLAGDQQALEKMFDVGLSGTEAAWTLQLSPRLAQARELFRRIELTGSGADVLSLTLERHNGDRSVTMMTPHSP
jgi:outer membrane lipoprotein carrier protein LolA